MPAELDAELQRAIARRFDDEPSATLANVGEAALLTRLREMGRTVGAAQPASATVITGPGDDAAVVRLPAGRDLVVSQDAIVEGQDFLRSWATPYGVGRRALEVALSDIAAMGAEPVHCLATLCAPAETALADVMALQAGLCAAARDANCPLVGGDVSNTTGPLVLDVSVAGVVEPGRHMRVDAAAVGDAVVVTGVVGRAAAGLRLLMGDAAMSSAAGATADVWRKSQLEPHARLAEGRALGAVAHAASDTSDGVVVSAATIASASGCQIELWVDHLPVDAALRAVDGWQALAATGGEDFEILATVPSDEIAVLLAGWPPAFAPLSVIGSVRAGSGVVVLDAAGGTAQPLGNDGARHFA